MKVCTEDSDKEELDLVELDLVNASRALNSLVRDRPGDRFVGEESDLGCVLEEWGK